MESDMNQVHSCFKIFSFKYCCFTVLCQSLLYKKVTQFYTYLGVYVYICVSFSFVYLLRNAYSNSLPIF